MGSLKLDTKLQMCLASTKVLQELASVGSHGCEHTVYMASFLDALFPASLDSLLSQYWYHFPSVTIPPSAITYIASPLAPSNPFIARETSFQNSQLPFLCYVAMVVKLAALPCSVDLFP